MKGSPLEGEKRPVTQSNNIRQILAWNGKFLGIVPMTEDKLSKNLQLVNYVVTKHNSQVFGAALFCRWAEGVVVTNVSFNTDLGQIMSNEVIFNWAR